MKIITRIWQSTKEEQKSLSLPNTPDRICKLLMLLVLTSFIQSCQSLPTKQAELFKSNLYDRQYTDIFGASFTPRLLNSKIIIINFWASWCIPCIEELPSMIKLKQHFSDSELTIISINTETVNQLMNIKKMHQSLNIKKEFIHVADQNTEIADSVFFTSIPVSVIFKNGKPIELIDGPTDFASPEFIKKMRSLLKN